MCMCVHLRSCDHMTDLGVPEETQVCCSASAHPPSCSGSYNMFSCLSWGQLKSLVNVIYNKKSVGCRISCFFTEKNKSMLFLLTPVVLRFSPAWWRLIRIRGNVFSCSSFRPLFPFNVHLNIFNDFTLAGFQVLISSILIRYKYSFDVLISSPARLAECEESSWPHKYIQCSRHRLAQFMPVHHFPLQEWKFIQSRIFKTENPQIQAHTWV